MADDTKPVRGELQWWSDGLHMWTPPDTDKRILHVHEFFARFDDRRGMSAHMHVRGLGREVQFYVPPAGRKLRVWVDGREV